jgi:2-polyprenyl-3-methyl-5-hydroxy-6-metoxy-1,4-benzoquinol methylase
MEYANLTIKNKNFLKRFSHKKRFLESSNLINEYKSKENISMLDFGSGDGFFIKYLIDKKFSFNFSAYDADPEQKQIKEMKNLFNTNNIKNVKIYNDYNSIHDKFDIISCLETLEHFNQVDQANLLNQMAKLLKPKGIICISVPIEVYLSGFFKMIFRTLVGQSHENSSFKNIIYTLFGKPIITPDNIHSLKTGNMKYINTHVGFYYFNLINLIKNMNFQVEEIKFSPFPKLKFFLNSQIFLKIKLKDL